MPFPQESLHKLRSLFVCLFFGLTACRILVPRPGIEPVPPAVEARSPNHWTAREVPLLFRFWSNIKKKIRHSGEVIVIVFINISLLMSCIEHLLFVFLLL